MLLISVELSLVWLIVGLQTVELNLKFCLVLFDKIMFSLTTKLSPIFKKILHNCPLETGKGQVFKI